MKEATQTNPSELTGKALREWQEAEILRHVSLVAMPNQVIELRIPKVDGRKNRTAAGYFDDWGALAKEGAKWSGRAAGIYITLNPVNPSLLARAANKVKDWSEFATGDSDITRRLCFLIDADPERPSGISSTDEEHEIALARSLAIQAWLTDMGWPQPQRDDSGNGGHLVYGIDLPNDPNTAQLLQRCLQAINAEWGDEAVKIDTTVYNASRISKLYGTAACKGDSTPDRPHRLSRILSMPETLEPVAPSLLHELSMLAPDANEPERKTYTGGAFDLADFIARHSGTLHPSPAKALSNGTMRWRIDCIHNPDHAGDAVVGQRSNGALWAKCSHNSCAGRWGWKELRGALEPKQDRPQTYTEPTYTNGTGPSRTAPQTLEEPPARAPFTERPHYTDLGNAQRMYDACLGQVMYVPAFGKWYIWAGTHWREDDNFAILSMAKRTVLGMYNELADCQSDDDRKTFLKWIVASESRARLESMIALLRSEPGISVQPDELDRDPMLLPCLNGTIDLRTGELIPSQPAHRNTRCLEVEYNPNAECPLWESFLIRIMGGNLELVSFLQRLIGHALTGDSTGKYFVFMYGPKGNNGKSTLAETIMRLLGPYALKSPSELVMAKGYRGGIPNDVARLRGVRLSVTNEVDEGMTLSQNTIKDLTGNDTLVARFMRAEFFDFRPTHKIWIYGNKRPEIRGTDNAVWDRVKLVPFEVEIPEGERDPQFGDKLAEELPGILAWAVRGCLAWQRQGIKTPDVVRQATGDYRADQDVIGQFIEDCCELGKTYQIGAGSVFKVYEAWCKELGIRAESGTKFGSELGRRGFEAKRTNSGKERLGLQLNTYGRGLLPAPAQHWTDDRD